MIYPVTMYSGECDNCKEEYYNEDRGWSAMVDENGILEMMGNDGWVKESGNHYCPKCFKYDDQDNFMVDKKRTKQSSHRLPFILDELPSQTEDKVLGHAVDVVKLSWENKQYADDRKRYEGYIQEKDNAIGELKRLLEKVVRDTAQFDPEYGTSKQFQIDNIWKDFKKEHKLC